MGARLWVGRLFRGSPVVATTIAGLLVVHLLVSLSVRFAPAVGGAVLGALVLDPASVLSSGRVWTLVTYGLVHSLSDPLHLVFNGLVLYWFGRDLEARWGSVRAALFLGASVLSGGLAVVITHVVGLGSADVLGVSAAAAGFVVAWGLTYRDRDVFFFFFRTRGIVLVYVTLGFEVLNALSLSGVSAAAHFGGMAVGAFFVGLLEPSPLRTAYLRVRLRRLEAQAGARVVLKRGPGGRLGPDLRVIEGGDKPPKDKRRLN